MARCQKIAHLTPFVCKAHIRGLPEVPTPEAPHEVVSPALAVFHDRSNEQLVFVLFRQASNPGGQLFALGPAASGFEACAATSTRSSSISRNSISASRGPDNSCKPAGTGGSISSSSSPPSCALRSQPRYRHRRSPRSRSERRGIREAIHAVPSSLPSHSDSLPNSTITNLAVLRTRTVSPGTMALSNL